MAPEEIKSANMKHDRVRTERKETQPVGPYVGVKSSPNVSKSYPRSSHRSFYITVRFFKIAQKIANNFGNFG